MNQFLRMVLHSKYISFYSTVCSSITRSCSMNIKHTASVEAVRLSIVWVDNMSKSKHNMSPLLNLSTHLFASVREQNGLSLCCTPIGMSKIPYGFCVHKQSSGSIILIHLLQCPSSVQHHKILQVPVSNQCADMLQWCKLQFSSFQFCVSFSTELILYF